MSAPFATDSDCAPQGQAQNANRARAAQSSMQGILYGGAPEQPAGGNRGAPAHGVAGSAPFATSASYHDENSNHHQTYLQSKRAADVGASKLVTHVTDMTSMTGFA
ncbi:hypothetical protein CYMTET_39666 [Cymbomonas tetramitiformis]|uniref:Uncharacterized protein n=1 Tax=Cymbomonas tetramitiformis TaxID=36881 RepID=A0AAE0CAU5_9CHLO|nr:hypothetical protein CYMTET_39666 [Cymbomonas tetramitiformis]